MYNRITLLYVHLKLTQHCKSTTTLQVNYSPIKFKKQNKGLSWRPSG